MFDVKYDPPLFTSDSLRGEWFNMGPCARPWLGGKRIQGLTRHDLTQPYRQSPAIVLTKPAELSVVEIPVFSACMKEVNRLNEHCTLKGLTALSVSEGTGHVVHSTMTG